MLGHLGEREGNILGCHCVPSYACLRFQYFALIMGLFTDFSLSQDDGWGVKVEVASATVGMAKPLLLMLFLTLLLC